MMVAMIPPLIAQRKRLWLPGQAPPAELRRYAYPLAKDRLGMTDPGGRVLTEQADDGRMGIPAIITTIDRDRVGDEVVPEGGVFDRFARNAVVFFGHQQLPIPVGKACWPLKDGPLEIKVEPGRHVLSWCFFHQSSPEGPQFYVLVKDGILTATSIGFNPLEEPERLGEVEGNLYAGYRFHKWELLEWSWCGVGANPYCGSVLRSYLSAGKIAGEPIGPAVRKALEPLAEVEKAWSTGWTPAAGHRKVAEQRQLIDNVQLLGSNYRPRKALTTIWKKAMSNKLTIEKLLKIMPANLHLQAQAIVKEGMAEDSGTEGGYAANADNPDEEVHKRVKAEIVDVAKRYKDDDAGLAMHYDSTKMAVHHQHSEGADQEHLKCVKSDLEGIEGVKEVTQGPGEPEGEGHEKVYPPKESGEEQPPSEDIKRLRQMLQQAIAAKKRKDDSASAVSADNPTDPEGEDQTVPHGAATAQRIIEQLEEALGTAEPEIREYLEEMLADCREWASERYPDIDFGGEENSEEEPETEDDKEGEEELTDSIMEHYRSGRIVHARRLVVQLAKRMNRRHKAICNEATEHLGDLAEMEAGSAFTRTHKAACKAHHAAMKSMLREMDGAADDEDGAGDGGSDEERAALGELRKSLAEASQKAVERSERVGKAFFALTGRKV